MKIYQKRETLCKLQLCSVSEVVSKKEFKFSAMLKELKVVYHLMFQELSQSIILQNNSGTFMFADSNLLQKYFIK
jgi:hypothetical protein